MSGRISAGGDRDQLIQAARTLRAEIVQETWLSLDDIFARNVTRS
jgi:hypothetical protein